jgi:hypothetical protein
LPSVGMSERNLRPGNPDHINRWEETLTRCSTEHQEACSSIQLPAAGELVVRESGESGDALNLLT